MTVFTRTPGGLAEKWRFHSKPTVWVEGPSDIFFFAPIAEGIPHRIEPFHGRQNAESLIQKLLDHDYPYLVVLDGDYDILKRSRARHRSVLTLRRYSMENYLWEPAAVNRACCRHAQCGDEKDLVLSHMETARKMIRRELQAAVILDVSARTLDPTPRVLPPRIESILTTKHSAMIDTAKVRALVSTARKSIGRVDSKEARLAVKEFLRNRCITHLLKGHLVLGLVGRIFSSAASAERGKRLILHDDVLMQLLANSVWGSYKSEDHRHLKRSYRRKLREAATRHTWP